MSTNSREKVLVEFSPRVLICEHKLIRCVKMTIRIADGWQFLCNWFGVYMWQYCIRKAYELSNAINFSLPCNKCVCTVLKIRSFPPVKCHLRERLLDYLLLKKSASESHRLLAKAPGDHAPIVHMRQNWFQRFKNGNSNVEDKDHGRSKRKFGGAKLQALCCQTQQQLALGFKRSSIANCLKAMGKI